MPFAAAASLAGIVTAGIAFGWFSPTTGEAEVVTTEPVVRNDTLNAPVRPPGKQENTPPEKNDPLQNKVINTDAESAAALAASAYIAEDFNETLLGVGEAETANNYSKAVKLYGAGRYQAALKLLEAPDSSQLQENLYLRGYTYYHLGQYAKAERDFRAFRKFRISDRKVDAVWGEVFCLVKQLPASRKRLNAVLLEITANPQHTYYDRALALQQALKKR